MIKYIDIMNKMYPHVLQIININYSSHTLHIRVHIDDKNIIQSVLIE